MNPKEYKELVEHNKSLGLTAAQIQVELKKLSAKYKQLTDELNAAKKNNAPNYEALKAAFSANAKQLRQEMNAWSAANIQANLKEKP